MPSVLATTDPAELCPKIVDGVRFVPQSVRPREAGPIAGASAGPHYRLESIDGRYFDVGYSEYVVLSQWDGTASLAESVSLAARRLRRDAISLDDATSLLEWSGQSGLIEGVPAEQAADDKLSAKLNPFWLKVPLSHPDRTLEALRPIASLLFSRLGFVLFAGLMLTAAVALPTRLDGITASMSGILTTGNWLNLALVWLGLKVVHELAHALAAKRYHTRVPEAGLVFILFAPCAYVDVTPSWSLRSRLQRITIAAAGLMAEGMIAAVIVLAWPSIASESGREIAANALFSATAGSLLFNGNPLMKFDGYYILSDLLRLPNLATRGQAALRQAVARIVLGVRASRRKREHPFVAVYAVAAAAWRVVVTVSLVAAAYTLAPGFGLPLAIAGAGILSIGGAKAVSTALLRATSVQRLRAISLAVVAASVTVLLLACPWPGRVSAPGVVDAGPTATIRAAADGFVDVIHLADGQTVSAGDPLLTLRNPQLESDVRQLTAELAQIALREDAARSRRELSTMQIERRRHEAVLKQLRIAADKVDRLLVTATQSGTFVSANFDQRLGTAVTVGDDLGLVTTPAQRVLASIPIDLLEKFRASEATDRRLLVVSPSGDTIVSESVRIAPRATYEPADDFLLATHGGPLPVDLSRETEEGGRQSSRPTFLLEVELPRGTDWPLRLPVAVQVRSQRSIAQQLWWSLTQTWESLTDR